MKEEFQVITEKKAETAILVGIITQDQDERKTTDYLDELEFLADTAGVTVMRRFTQKIPQALAATYVGKGKLEEMRDYIKQMEDLDEEVGMAIFDDELTAKQMSNARLIGKRTFGGLCALAGNETSSLNYSGHVGIRNETPVYVYLPTLCIFDIDKKPIEGIGVTPDIEVDFDMTKMGTTGCDSQLDRALEYIRNGN